MTIDPAASEARARYAGLLRQAKGRMSVRSLGELVGLAGTTVQDYVTGKTLPKPDAHEALVRVLCDGAPGSDNDRLGTELDEAYAVAAGEPPPVPDGRVVVLTLGSIPLRLLGALGPAIEDVLVAAGYTDVRVAAGNQVTALPPAAQA